MQQQSEWEALHKLTTIMGGLIVSTHNDTPTATVSPSDTELSTDRSEKTEILLHTCIQKLDAKILDYTSSHQFKFQEIRERCEKMQHNINQLVGYLRAFQVLIQKDKTSTKTKTNSYRSETYDRIDIHLEFFKECIEIHFFLAPETKLYKFHLDAIIVELQSLRDNIS